MRKGVAKTPCKCSSRREIYNCDMRDDGDIKKLDFIAKWLPEVEAFDKNAKEEFLIIIGNGAPKHKANPTYTKFDYRGYLYNASLGKLERIYINF